MAQEWKEWYVDGPNDTTYKVCRGKHDGEEEVSLYRQIENGTFELEIQIVGLSTIDADIVADRFIKEHDTKKVFSSSSRVGKSKATDYN